MKQDKRKTRRRIIHHRARILLDGDQTLPCTILDVSDIGARLEAKRVDAVPNRFDLLLAEGDRGPRRDCRVVWREGFHLGVSFENRGATTAATA